MELEREGERKKERSDNADDDEREENKCVVISSLTCNKRKKLDGERLRDVMRRVQTVQSIEWLMANDGLKDCSERGVYTRVY